MQDREIRLLGLISLRMLQPVRKKIILEMLVEMQIETLNDEDILVN